MRELKSKKWPCWNHNLSRTEDPVKFLSTNPGELKPALSKPQQFSNWVGIATSARAAYSPCCLSWEHKQAIFQTASKTVFCNKQTRLNESLIKAVQRNCPVWTLKLLTKFSTLENGDIRQYYSGSNFPDSSSDFRQCEWKRPHFEGLSEEIYGCHQLNSNHLWRHCCFTAGNYLLFLTYNLHGYIIKCLEKVF